MRLSRPSRRVLFGFSIFLIAVVALVARPTAFVVRTAWNDVDELPVVSDGFIDDASRLNQTPVREVWPVPADAKDAEVQLASLLRRANAEGLPVSIAGARHSMGGHTIATEGIVVDMRPWNEMRFDAEKNLLHVQSGATWEEIIPYLDRHGRSVAVMQSNNSFTVGGSLSVNCHGWSYNQPPIASTVESFRLMRPTGEIVRCSRVENAELFSLVLGGYAVRSHSRC